MVLGRPKIPDNVKALNDDRVRGTVPNQPKPPRALIAPPTHMEPASRTVWHKLAHILDQMQLLTVADGFVMEQYCDQWVMRQRCLAKLNADGYSYETTNKTGDAMHRPRPEVGILFKSEASLRALGGTMGLSPADRARVSVILSEAAEDSDLADYG